MQIHNKPAMRTSTP